MLMYFSPSNWLFIFIALLLTGYIKLASAKTQKPVFFAGASISHILR